MTFRGPLGTVLPLELEMFVKQPDGTEKKIDGRNAQVRLEEVEEWVRLYRFAGPNGAILETAMLPGEVVPHAAAVVSLDAPAADYAFLFFVRRYPDGAPILQVVVPPDAPEKYRALALPLREYRSYGGSLRH